MLLFLESTKKQIKEEVTRHSEAKKTELDQHTHAAKVTIDEHAGNLELLSQRAR